MVFAFAFSGEEALCCIEKYDHEAILILSDINMPGMSGLDLLEKIKQKIHTPPPVVMMITAYGDTENYKRAMELGADDFLTKPVDFIKLKEKIKPWKHSKNTCSMSNLELLKQDYKNFAEGNVEAVVAIFWVFIIRYFQGSAIRCVALENVGILQKTFGVNGFQASE